MPGDDSTVGLMRRCHRAVVRMRRRDHACRPAPMAGNTGAGPGYYQAAVDSVDGDATHPRGKESYLWCDVEPHEECESTSTFAPRIARRGTVPGRAVQ